MLHKNGILLEGVFSNNPLASFSFVNLELLLSQTAHFNKSIGFPFFVFATLGFLLSVLFYI